jgi:kynurenine formamidase
MDDACKLLSQMKIVDLTVPISPDHPTYWPGGNPLEIEKISWYDHEEPYFNRLLKMEEHTGTHVDAPAHFIPDPDLDFPNATSAGKLTVEKIELKQLVAPCAVMDASDLVGKAEPAKSPLMSLEQVKQWEQEHGAIRAGECVLMSTGWTDRYYRPGDEGKEYAERAVLEQSVPAWPAFSIPCIDYFTDKGVTLVGTDCPSGGGLDIIIETHYAALGKGMPFVESLTNLKELPPRGAIFIFLPLKIVGGSGAPGRAIALIPDESLT